MFFSPLCLHHDSYTVMNPMLYFRCRLAPNNRQVTYLKGEKSQSAQGRQAVK